MNHLVRADMENSLPPGSQASTKLDYLTGAKGIACLIVSFNHFMVFWPAGKAFPLPFLINGTYMLSLFYLLSAFLFGLSFFNRSSLEKLEKGALMRAFRLILPVFFACLFIWALMKLHMYDGYDQMTAVTLRVRKEADALNYHTQYSLWQVLKTSVSSVLGKGTTKFAFPLWMLPKMTYGYVLAVFTALCIDKLKPPFSILAVATGMYFCDYDNDMFLGGVLLAYLFVRKREWFERKWSSFLGIAAGIAALLIGNYVLPHNGIDNYYVFHAAGGLCLGFALLTVKPLQKLLSRRMIVYLGEISFAIYLLHDPIQITVGSHVFNWIYSVTHRIAFSTPAAFIASYAVLIPAAVFFHRYVERLCARTSGWIYSVIAIPS